jgi:Gram-negative bacterial TonB protein C-terminal
MKTNFSISIPKPCHEDWSKMSPNEKGRFCQSCSKSVIDFTEMPQQSIEKYLNNNGDKRICGRFKVSQLDQIRIEIPQHIFQKRMSFHKFFLLALLIAMGTSLLSCSDENGNTKKIDAVEVISTLKAESIETPEITAPNIQIDSTKTITITKKPDPIDKIDIPIPVLKGIVVEVMGDIAPPEPIINDDEVVFGYLIVDQVPEFIDTPKTISKTEKKDYFSKRITEFVNNNFDLGQGDLGIKGKQKILAKFTINKSGDVTDIKIRAPHPQLEKESLRVIKLLPQFIPGKQRGKNVSVTYTLPIIFVAED